MTPRYTLRPPRLSRRRPVRPRGPARPARLFAARAAKRGCRVRGEAPMESAGRKPGTLLEPVLRIQRRGALPYLEVEHGAAQRGPGVADLADGLARLHLL